MPNSRIERVVFFIVFVSVFALASTQAAPAQSKDDSWRPTSEADGHFDWIQMKSGEWLKGEFIAMYDENVEFDSEEFEMQNLDWGDVKQIHTSRIVNVGLTNRTAVTGKLILNGDEVTIVGDETRTFRKSDVLTITAGPPKEINYWSAKLFLGLMVSKGNSDVFDTNVQANVKRRTTTNRVVFDFNGNLNRADGVDNADNQRANIAWDLFISKRFFLKPAFGEYYRDPFQNISSRYTFGVGVGYQLIDTPTVDWQVSGGPAYQETHYGSVVPGDEDTESTPAAILGTTVSWDLTKWLEFDAIYNAQFVNKASGSYNQHLLLSLETEITSVIDFDISWVWDRIQNPVANSDGVVPEQDDFRTTVGLTFEF
jgi:putative salt-induced outer membrane protein YdiY